jgi:hypothetical protein
MNYYGGMKASLFAMPTPAAFKTIAAGPRHACAIDTTGGFAC